MFILGFGLYCGLSVPAYFESYTAANGHGPVDTGSDTFNSIANSLFATPAAVCLLCTLLLDVTVPAAPGERPWEAWQRSYSSVTGNRGQKWYEDGEMDKVRGQPLFAACVGLLSAAAVGRAHRSGASAKTCQSVSQT